MLLSVVIPFYNVERYLGACLERAARLPEDDCELLLVDDRGQDASADIARRFCAGRKNARLLARAQNGGLSAARNTGLSAARGEYVYFLDSDDLPEADALYRLAFSAREQALDVAKARFRALDDGTGALSDGPVLPATGVTDGGALFAAECRAALYEPMVWQCVYRRAFLRENRLTMAEGLLFEDELFQTSALLRARRAASFEDVILLYRRRAGSIMDSFSRSSRWCESYLAVCERLCALAASLPACAARAALQKRVGQIALSVAKNIPAYGLEGDVRREARAFLARHLGALSRYAIRSGSACVAAQGLLLRASPGAFIALYNLAKGR